MLYTSIDRVVLYGLLNGIYFAFFALNFWNIIFFQLIYFYIICYYIKLKIREIHKRIYQLSKGIDSKDNIISIMKSMNKLYEEIAEYNITYWSKFLLSFWFTFGSATVLLIFSVLFVSMILLTKIAYFYVMILFIIVFLFIIFTASSVNSEANKSYKIMNHFMATNMRSKSRKSIYKIKVWILVLF